MYLSASPLSPTDIVAEPRASKYTIKSYTISPPRNYATDISEPAPREDAS